MPNYRRLYNSGGTYAFTICLADRRSDVLTSNIGYLRKSFASVRLSHPFELLAICVLPDHLHMLCELPDGDSDFSTRINQLKGRFTKQLPEHLKHIGRKRERGVWQHRFWEHCIRDDADFEDHFAYIHDNPVRHGYVSHPGHRPACTTYPRGPFTSCRVVLRTARPRSILLRA
ncbi:MAG: transposase [Pseudomonadota bacterium]